MFLRRLVEDIHTDNGPWNITRSKMKSITQTYVMNASPEKVFAALTDPDIIKTWSGAPAEMDAKAGTKFSMFGGHIVGSNLEVIPGRKLVQSWASSDWDKPSTVTFTLRPSAEGTTVDLQHDGVPDSALASISDGWNTSFLGQMQKMFAPQK